VPPISGIFVTVDYRLEVEPTGANSARLDQFDDDNADDSVGPLFVRHSYMYLSSKKYGEVRLGLTATPIYTSPRTPTSASSKTPSMATTA
jgi:hypothetical protein